MVETKETSYLSLSNIMKWEKISSLEIENNARKIHFQGFAYIFAQNTICECDLVNTNQR